MAGVQRTASSSTSTKMTPSRRASSKKVLPGATVSRAPVRLQSNTVISDTFPPVPSGGHVTETAGERFEVARPRPQQALHVDAFRAQLVDVRTPLRLRLIGR